MKRLDSVNVFVHILIPLKKKKKDLLQAAEKQSYAIWKPHSQNSSSLVCFKGRDSHKDQRTVIITSI